MSARFEVTFPRRQAMLSIQEHDRFQDGYYMTLELGRVPVLVWPLPDVDGRFIVEHQDGSCTKAWPHELTFLDSKELFDQYDWSTHVD